MLPTWAFHTAIVMMWGFVYGTGILGVIVTENGKNDGGLYVRAGAWCWINSNLLRLINLRRNIKLQWNDLCWIEFWKSIILQERKHLNK
ncbi:hypothetical protein K4K53_010714 [Colletotrichum sp. SAR 10_77]|nr:hypothetical protein K4K53_010714 [Colletotrichum sp. SAR 10_77]